MEVEDRKYLSSDSPKKVMVNVFSGQRMYTLSDVYSVTVTE